MKNKQRLFSLILLALLMSSGLLFSLKIAPVKANPDGVNVVSNFSFEDGLTDWTVTYASYGYNPQVNSVHAHDGTYSLRQGYGGGAMRMYTVTQNLLNIDSDQVEDCYAWFYRGLNANYAFLRITYSDASYDQVETAISSAATWQKVSVTPDAGKLITDIRVGQITGDTSYLDMDDRAYVDDVHLDVVPAFITADLEPDDTGTGWVFTEWRDYTFTVEIPSYAYLGDLDYVYLGFTELIYSNGTFGFSAWSNGTGWEAASNIQPIARDLEPVRVSAGSWENDSDGTVITFPLWFTKRTLDLWLDDDAVDCLLWFNDTTGADSGWITVNPNYFRVYTDGGFSRVSDGYGDPGYYGTLPGGRDFNMFCYNDSYVFKDMYWRNLQHIKLVPEIQFRAGYQYFQFNLGVDYVLNDGTYQPGLHLQLEPDAVSYTGVFASNVWINYTASWYSNNTLIKEEDLYAFYHGEVYAAGDYGRVKFFIDFWFDSGNASSLQGGRINAYEFPMKDSSGAWFRWLSSNWGVMDEVQKQSECIVPLFKYGAEERINSERIEFVRVWSSLSVPAGAYDQYVAAINYDTFDTTLGENPLKGIQTPPWDETQMPAVRNTGALGAIWSMFSGIGAWLGENILWGGLNLWGTFVNFLDTIAGWLGAPGFFTNLFNWIGEGFSYLGTSAGYAWDVLANIFIMIGSLIGAFMVTVGELIGSFVNTLAGFVDFMGGGVGAAGNLWDQLGIMTWVTVFIVFYPLYLVILWEEKGMDAVIQQLTWIFGILVFLYHFFEGLVMGVISLITSLIESIPVAE